MLFLKMLHFLFLGRLFLAEGSMFGLFGTHFFIIAVSASPGAEESELAHASTYLGKRSYLTGVSSVLDSTQGCILHFHRHGSLFFGCLFSGICF